MARIVLGFAIVYCCACTAGSASPQPIKVPSTGVAIDFSVTDKGEQGILFKCGVVMSVPDRIDRSGTSTSYQSQVFVLDICDKSAKPRDQKGIIDEIERYKVEAHTKSEEVAFYNLANRLKADAPRGHATFITKNVSCIDHRWTAHFGGTADNSVINEQGNAAVCALILLGPDTARQIFVADPVDFTAK